MKNIALSFIAISSFVCISTVVAAPNVDKPGQLIFRIKLAPIGGEMLVTDIRVNPEELDRIRLNHPGVPRDEVAPCLTDGAFFSPKYSRVDELRELRIAPEEVIEGRSGYGVIRSYPLQVIPNTGEPFVAMSRFPGDVAQHWGICLATGELGKFARGFENLTMRAVNSTAVMQVRTLEVMALKNIDQKEAEDLKAAEVEDFIKAKETGTLEAITRFVIQYTFADIGNLIPSAEKQRKQLVDAANAPIVAEQARQRAEQSRQQVERARQFEQASNAFRASIQAGAESNCGPVLEIKNNLVKIYHPVANYGNEHWIRKDVLFQAGVGCRFVNGTYQGK